MVLIARIPGLPAAIAILWCRVHHKMAIGAGKPCNHIVSRQKVWKTSLKACRRQVFRLMVLYVLRKNSQRAIIFFILGRVAKTSNIRYSPLITIHSVKFGWNWMNSVGAVAFWQSYNICKICKGHQMTPNQTRAIGHENHPTYVHCTCCIVARVPNLCPFCSVIIFRILGFPIESHVKIFQSVTKFLKLARLSRKVIACILPWQPMPSS